MNPDSETRGTCPVCGYRYRVSVPRGGDGSARVMAKHHLFCGNTPLPNCEGSRRICKEDERLME